MNQSSRGLLMNGYRINHYRLFFCLTLTLAFFTGTHAQSQSQTPAPSSPLITHNSQLTTQLKVLADSCDTLKAGGFGSAANILTRNKTLYQTAVKGLALVPAGDPLDSARFLSYIAYTYSHGMELNPDSIGHYYRLCLEKAMAAHSPSLIATASGSLLHIEFEMGHADRSEEYKKVLQSILDTTTDRGILRDGYSTLGSYYQHKGYYSTAQDYYLKSITIRKKQLDILNDPKSRLDYANQTIQLAKLYMITDMPDKSLAILNEGRRYKGVTGLVDYRLVSAFIDAFCKMGNIDSALYYLHHRVDSLEVQVKNRSNPLAEVVMPNLAIAQYYIGHGQPTLARPFLDKSDSLTKGKEGSFLGYEIQRLKGKYFLLTGNPAKAIPQLTAALPMATMLSRENYADILKDLALANKAMGNTSASLEYFERHVQTLDSLTNEKISRTFADQETRYQTNEKEEKIASLDKDNRLKILELKDARHTRLILVVGLAALGAFALLLYFVYRNKENLNKALGETNRQLALANDTKARLFGIISHDLRAPVSSIIQLLTVQQQRPELLDPAARGRHEEKIRTATTHVLETMEDLLFWSKSQMTQFTPQPLPTSINATLQKEIQLLQGLIDGRRLRTTIDLPANLTRTTDENFLSIILRNLLQNAAKFSDEGGTIHITGDSKTLHITNPSSGIDVSAMNARLHGYGQLDNKTSGLGLQIAQDLAVAIGISISFHQDQHLLTASLQWPD